jgi:septum formation protein
MKNRKIVLGSASPRRSEILSQVGFEFEIIPSRKDEIITKEIPSEIVMELSLQKALDVKEQIRNDEKYKDALIICADTMVAHEKEVLGKPRDEEDAKRMLDLIQNQVHNVYTGVTIMGRVNGKEKIETFYSNTEVYMNPMNEDEIAEYVATGECIDKAGSYAIQGYGAKFIHKIVGDYYNVMGLPIEKIYNKLICDF